MAVENPGPDSLPETVKSLYIHWYKVFRKDDRVSQFTRLQPPRGTEDAQERSVSQILLASNLDDLGISRDAETQTMEACSAIVDVLFEVAPKALEAWVEDHDEPIEFLADYNDPRIIAISKLAQTKLIENDIS